MTQAEMQSHTLGKRVVRGTRVGVIDERDGVLIMTARAFSGTGSTLAEQEANARRLAACENACWNIPTEALEANVVAEMLAAAEAMMSMLEDQSSHIVMEGLTAAMRQRQVDAFAAVYAATAKAKAS